MLDRSIPFYNLILRCDRYPFRPVALPPGCAIVPYEKGLERDWARMECAIGDFETPKEAEGYFLEKYAAGSAPEKLLFLKSERGQTVGACICWEDLRQGKAVHSLHWLVVDEAYQGRGLGRALCTEAMDRFYLSGGGPVYIHTQPWSWKAILLYTSLGFQLQKTDAFAAYANQYDEAMEALRAVLSPEQYARLALASDP